MCVLMWRAQEVADDLLASAGISVAWRLCDTSESCRLEDSPTPEVVVNFSARDRPDGRGYCGVAALGSHVAEGTVTVSVPCVAHVAFRLKRRIDARAHPMLAAGKYDDLLGAVAAHEIGHVLGLRHVSTGLMRPRFEADDIVALRLRRLGFSEPESVRMRAAVASTQVVAERHAVAHAVRLPVGGGRRQ